MALHPAPPTDVRGLIDAWRHTVQAVIDLGHSCHQADFERPTACPGWTVKDQISHIVGTELWVGTGEVPQVQVPWYGHVRHEMGAFLEKAIEVLAPKNTAQVNSECWSAWPLAWMASSVGR